jgi:hypothetical protein
MKIDDAQKQQIAAWIAGGAKLSDVQKRIVAEFGIPMTYMEVRLLVDDLKLVPSDPVRPKEEKLSVLTAPAAPAAPAAAPAAPAGQDPLKATGPGGDGVTVGMDAMARPGTLASGTVKFSDGQTGAWYLDEQGRLGVAPAQKGYKPAAADVEAFQRKLEVELARIGY